MGAGTVGGRVRGRLRGDNGHLGGGFTDGATAESAATRGPVAVGLENCTDLAPSDATSGVVLIGLDPVVSDLL